MASFLKQLVFLLLVWSMAGKGLVHADVYTWTDSHGVKHYSNIAPPQANTRLEIQKEEIPLFQDEDFKVTKVYDGDTIQVKGAGIEFKVRLAGIDAPESKWKTRPAQPFSQEAKNALAGLIARKKVQVIQHGTGGYNRVLGEVFSNGVNINLEMVKLGMAEVYQGSLPPTLDASALAFAQKQAKRSGLGIWSQGKAYKSPKIWRRIYSIP